MADLSRGVYDRLIDQLLHDQLSTLDAIALAAETRQVDAADLPDRVGRLVGNWVAGTLRTVSKDRDQAALELTQQILDLLTTHSPDATGGVSALTDPIQSLSAITDLAPDGNPKALARPLTPLRDTVLMTNDRKQPSIGHEIEAEIASADEIDVLLAFIRWSGIRDLVEPLRAHVADGKPLRVLTTTYTGSTEARALDELVALGAEVKVSYDTSNTRLHAKAWRFGRHSGYSTVYIGSSNLTFSAQVTGLEWNVRASQDANPALVASFEQTFDTYWADASFEAYDAEHIARETSTERDDSISTPFELRPYPFQRQMLDRLELARRRGQAHNLVVAATGTGKTVLAAFDYKRLAKDDPSLSLLFVAHRKEILDQSRTVFRHVLTDGAFGELWVGGGDRPSRWNHVFASIQTLSASGLDAMAPDAFDMVIVDEFHHAHASTYRRVLEHLKPRYLLGLTATPERADCGDILAWFDGETTVELRLWDALEQGLLCPFHYYGIHDATDLSGVRWRRGTGYDTAELTNVYTGDDFWVSKILSAVRQKVAEPTRMRALGFCVSIDHAEFMANRFTRAGIESVAITSRTAASERDSIKLRLNDGSIQVAFTVDLFNEGVDVPAVDTILMLRPTDSATVFMQQLGRGLRRSEGKDVLTVLDFVGHQADGFRFDNRFRSTLGRTRRQLIEDVQTGFPFLPAGCQIHLDDIASEIVLDNLKRALPTGWKDRQAEMRALGEVPLAEFLAETGLELADVYRGGHCWSELRSAVGLALGADGPDSAAIAKGVGRLIHVDDDERIDAYQSLLSSDAPPLAANLDERERRRLHGLLLVLLNPKKEHFAGLDEAAAHLWRHEALRLELLELLPLLRSGVIHLPRPHGLLAPVPLVVHASYSQQEILAAFARSRVERPLRLQAGVYYEKTTQTDLFFVTLSKSEKDYSPTTLYRDYAISDELFHWESQSITSVDGPTGQRYLNHRAMGTNVALFVRNARTDPQGNVAAYQFLGLADYISHRSERPIQITWKLRHPLPGDTFAAFRAAIA